MLHHRADINRLYQTVRHSPQKQKRKLSRAVTFLGPLKNRKMQNVSFVLFTISQVERLLSLIDYH